MCPFPVDGFLGFLYLSAFAKLSIMLVCVTKEILENLDFPVYFCELVCVLLIVHDASPQTRILRLFLGHYGANPALLINRHGVHDPVSAPVQDWLRLGLPRKCPPL